MAYRSPAPMAATLGRSAPGVGRYRRSRVNSRVAIDQSDRVDRERPCDADRPDDHAADRRSGQHADLRRERGQRDRGWQLLVCDHAGEQRVPARPLKRVRDRQQPADQVDDPHLGLVGDRVNQERGGEHDLSGAGEHQHRPTVDTVGQRSAVEAEDDQGDELDDPHHADREVRVGQVIDLERQSHVPDHLPQVEDRAGAEQDPEVAAVAHRREVEPQPRDQAAYAGRSLGLPIVDRAHERESWHDPSAGSTGLSARLLEW